MINVGSNGTNKYFRIPYGAYLNNNGQGYPEIWASATQIDSNIVSGNIKAGTNICGVQGKSSVVDTADATATESQILSGFTAWVNGNKITGNQFPLSIASGTISMTAGQITTVNLGFSPKVVIVSLNNVGLCISSPIVNKHLTYYGGSYETWYGNASSLFANIPVITPTGFTIEGGGRNVTNANYYAIG
ncbi:hypothetical protein [Clostridium beijerinckii]|uniref:hypothetical protein n=1 Tax=Clostridium beijerinckii TaxID=1520 RepID=UPI0015C707AE|nr:hypothetical protein [Clostridium beijerinckii]NYC05425.1 hypothetical protein [Clostridium beijerinckii]